MKVNNLGHDMKNISGKELELLNMQMTTMKHQLRIKLFKLLLDQKLATRDVFYFFKGQTEQRTFNKALDWGTMKSAMNTKISDVALVLRDNL